MPVFRRQRRVGIFPGICFGHEYRDDRGWELSAITAIRPDDGQEHPNRFDLVCPGCKEDSPLFVLRVYSMRATRIKRYLWALNSVLGFGILMFGLLTFERIRDEGFPVFIGFCIFTYAFCRWWNEDGVEICTRQRGHRLRW